MRCKKRELNIEYRPLMVFKTIAIVIFFFCISTAAAQTLYVKQISGTQTDFSLNDIHKIIFAQGNIEILNTNNSTNEFALNGLQYLNFTDLTSSVLEQPVFNGNLVVYPNPVMDVLNIDLSCVIGEGTICIKTIEGKVLSNNKTSFGSIVRVNIGFLPQGVYVCTCSSKFENRIVKIIKQ